MSDLWKQIAGQGGRELGEDQLARMEVYLELLLEENKKMNLTRVTDPEQARVLHVADALTLLQYIPGKPPLLADVGSGGGVPGLVLAIALPETRVVLVEATGKKCDFLKRTAAELALGNVEVRHARAEDAGRDPKLRDACDVVTARAVGALVFVAEWCLPLARKGGKLLAMKGPKLAEELPAAKRAIRVLSGGEPVVHAVTGLPGVSGYVVCEIAKVGRTDAKYPRAASVVKGKPL